MEMYARVSVGDKMVGMPQKIVRGDSRQALFFAGYRTFDDEVEAARWLFNQLRKGWGSPCSDRLKHTAANNTWDLFFAEFVRQI